MQPLKKALFLLIVFALFELVAQGVFANLSRTTTYQNWFTTQFKKTDGSFNWFYGDKRYHPFLTFESRQVPQVEPPDEPETFRLGLLGGSFAEEFANYMKNPKGEAQLLEILRELGTQTKFKKIELLNFTAGGSKQPRQFMASMLYFERANAFISLEGFNEVATLNLTCAPIDWPLQIHHYDADLHTFYQDLAGAIRNVFNFLKAAPFASTKIILYFTSEPLFTLFERLGDMHWRATWNLPVCKNKSAAELEAFQDRSQIRNIWFKTLIKQHQMFSGVHKTLYTFLQPNQYLEHSKVWSEEEKEIFSHGDPGLPPIVAKEYSLAREQFRKMSQKNPKLVDFTMIFEKNRETIYRDSCCHIREHGNDLLLQELKPYIKKAILNY